MQLFLGGIVLFVIYSYNKLFGKIAVVLALLTTLGIGIWKSIDYEMGVFAMADWTTINTDSF